MECPACQHTNPPNAKFCLESGGAMEEPFIRLELAELARLTGDANARQRELREAHRLFTDMGAPIRAAQVEAMLQDIGSGEVAT